MKKLRIMIVDDNSVFRKSVSNWIKQNSKHSVAAMAENGEEAIEMAKKIKPDLILMDISMPKMDGITAAGIIKQMENPPKIIICSIYDSDEYKEKADHAGVDGFLNKSYLSTKLIPAIDTIFRVRGNSFFSRLYRRKA